MTHQNAVKQLKTYGPLAESLDKLTDEVDDRFGEGLDTESALKDFLKFCDSNDLQALVKQLAKDEYSFNRELAAVTIWYLWMGWCTLPYTSAQAKKYESSVKGYLKKQEWATPIILSLLDDNCVGPVELALRAVAELDTYITSSLRKQVESRLLALTKHRSEDIRLSTIRLLAHIYPQNQEARFTLPPVALECFVQAMTDPSIKVRSWACFETWSSVENISEDMEKILEQLVANKDTDGETYVEAIVGLARLGHQELDALICQRLSRDDFGKGWVFAAEASHSSECLDALINAYQFLVDNFPEDSSLDFLELALMLWND